MGKWSGGGAFSVRRRGSRVWARGRALRTLVDAEGETGDWPKCLRNSAGNSGQSSHGPHPLIRARPRFVLDAFRPAPPCTARGLAKPAHRDQRRQGVAGAVLHADNRPPAPIPSVHKGLPAVRDAGSARILPPLPAPPPSCRSSPIPRRRSLRHRPTRDVPFSSTTPSSSSPAPPRRSLPPVSAKRTPVDPRSSRTLSPPAAVRRLEACPTSSLAVRVHSARVSVSGSPGIGTSHASFSVNRVSLPPCCHPSLGPVASVTNSAH